MSMQQVSRNFIKLFLITMSIVVFSLFSTVSATASDLDLSAARSLALTAEQTSSQQHAAVVVTVVDSGARVILVERMTGAQLGSLEVSGRKAASAVLYKRPTRVFEQGLTAGRSAILSLPGAMPAAGGVPLFKDGSLIGAIGVSGGTNAQDDAAAQSAVDNFTNGHSKP